MHAGRPPQARLAAFVAALRAAAVVHATRFPIVEHTALYVNGTLQIDSSVEVPRFDPGPEALEHLRREGYVVIRDVANASELAHARNLYWEFLEGAGVGVVRDKPGTWIRSRPNQYGIVWEFGVGQSRLMWFLRTRPRLLRMFALVWGTADLISSFEGFSTFPPPAQEPAWSIAESWFHTDQNAVSRPGLQTVQSFTSLYDQDETTGAFVVVPRSWEAHTEVTRRVYAERPRTDPQQQFLMLSQNDPVLLQRHAPPHLVRCRAGDAVLWDSRTVHCNTPSLGDGSAAAGAPPPRDPDGHPRPNRAVGYASLAPRARAPASVLRERQRAVVAGQTCTHWPFEMTCLPPPAEAGQVHSDPLMHVGSLEKSLVGFTERQLRTWLEGAAGSGLFGTPAPTQLPPGVTPRFT